MTETDIRPPVLAEPVHYAHRDGTCRAAIVARVLDSRDRLVSVFVLQPELSHTAYRDAAFSQDGASGSWHHVDTPGAHG